MRRVFALAMTGCVLAAAAPVGPTTAQFTTLRRTKGEACPPMRRLMCAATGDATELKCSSEERFEGATKWTASTALVARDGAKWVWLDGGPRCSPLAQH